MRVAGNKLKHLSDFYFSELKDLYEPSEIQALFHLAVHHFLGLTPSLCQAKINEHINQSELINLYNCCKDLKKSIPIQYIFGETEFYGLRLFVTPDVLIPRPETEELVDLIIKSDSETAVILDIGTGSGCIPISLKKQLPAATVFACDISDQALTLAKKNARLNQVEIRFFEGDALNVVNFSKLLSCNFDVIVSNPPYIQYSEKNSLGKNVLDHEPHLALFVDDTDAIVFYRRIIDLCKTQLSAKGRLYFELNPLTADEVKNYAEQCAIFKSVELLKDMSGNLRFLKAIRN